MARLDRSIYRGNYTARRKALFATTTPTTRCWRCGRTYAQMVQLHGERAATWQSGHVGDEANGPLAHEHAKCNAEAGARNGIALHGKPINDPHSQSW